MGNGSPSETWNPRTSDPREEWFLYVLRCADSSYYCGITNDLQRRLADHSRGLAAKYTRAESKRPLHMVFSVGPLQKRWALHVEYRFKRLRSRKLKEEFMESQGNLFEYMQQRCAYLCVHASPVKKET